MSNRSCLILFLFFAIASGVSAQNATLQVQIYDDAGLEPTVRQQLVSRLEAVLAGAELSAEVNIYGHGTCVPCETQYGRRQCLIIRLRPRQAGSMVNAQRSPLGRSVADQTGGQYASVFLEPVQEHAADTGVPWITVLAYATAHEIGHLLLGSGAHTPTGLMKATWDHHDFLAMSQQHCQFSREQIKQLANRYGIDHQSQGQSRIVARSN